MKEMIIKRQQMRFVKALIMKMIMILMDICLE